MLNQQSEAFSTELAERFSWKHTRLIRFGNYWITDISVNFALAKYCKVYCYYYYYYTIKLSSLNTSLFLFQYFSVGMYCLRYARVGRDFSGAQRIQQWLGGDRRRWDDNIKINFEETRCGGVKLIPLVEDRVTFQAFLKTVMKFHVPQTKTICWLTLQRIFFDMGFLNSLRQSLISIISTLWTRYIIKKLNSFCSEKCRYSTGLK